MVFHAVDASCADELVYYLFRAGCRGEDLTNAERLMLSGAKNEGFTYSNMENRETVMVIGATSSGREYWNSLDHEKLHLLQDISIAENIDPLGEEISYISGEFISEVYDKAKGLLCDCCRRKNLRMLS